MYQLDRKWDDHHTADFVAEKLSGKQAIIIGVLLLTITGLAIGVIQYDWYIVEIAALFLMMGVLAGIIGRLTVNEMAAGFVDGCRDLVVGALVVGLAYGILVVLEESHTIDTVLFHVSSLIGELPSSFSAVGMYLTQGLINFIVPSGSGQAALTMPIMTPLADLTGVSRQTAVLAFQLGDGISNALTPTAGVLMASLAIARIPWTKWVRWILPLMVIFYLTGAIAVTIAHQFIWVAS